MKIYEIISESVDYSAEDIAKMLRQDCATFLAEIKNDLYKNRLWRGVNILPTSIAQFTTRKDRDPVDMPKAVSKAIDDYFQETTGIRWRSTSVFASGNHHAAMYYGNLFCLFPIGQFNYCWSPRVSDLFNKLDQQLGNNRLAYRDFDRQLDAVGEEISPGRQELAFKTLHDTIMPSFEYRVGTGLIDAIEMANAEIMITCDKYYLVGKDVINEVSKFISLHATMTNIYGPQR